MVRKKQRFLVSLILFWTLLLMLVGQVLPHATAQEPTPTPDPQVEALLDSLSPQERVGQLFMVTFVGDDVQGNEAIASLIQDYHVGGVLLQTKNGNITNEAGTPARVLNLTHDLQLLAQNPRPLTSTAVLTEPVQAPTPLPLFIAVEQEGNGYPHTALRNGFTPVPGAMALGATWDVENARWTGEVVGRELEAVGVNMLLGPSLDVTSTPPPKLPDTVGSRVFGGDPYWVGILARSYIQGVHQGSQGKVLTVAKHFPGLGASDRRPDVEVATIPKSLDELRRIELAPFFAVMTPSGDDLDTVTDGVRTAHVQYRGFQEGNIRQVTGPISLDARNLPLILDMPEILAWRQRGGLVVSGPLGARAVLVYYKASAGNFPARRIARDAFLAGNDVLLLADFAAVADYQVQYENIIGTIEFFREQYRADPTFQARVDDAVRRILKAKIELFGPLPLPPEAEVVPQDEDRLAVLTNNVDRLSLIAQSGATLIYPSTVDLADRLPGPPEPDENIVILTDDRRVQECPACPTFTVLDTSAVENAILRLFGPAATGQVQPEQIASFSFSQLKALLSEEPPPEAALLNTVLDGADWIIFAMLDVNATTFPQSDAVKEYLRERGTSGKKVIVLAFDAPYYLDTTEVTRLTAYYGLYGKTPANIDAAVRALFQQFQPREGASPVSVDATGYNLTRVLEPDPNQVISLEWMLESPEGTPLAPTSPTPEVTVEGTPNPVEIAEINLGDVILLRTGSIVDHNGHPVPDGTPVDFLFTYPLEGLELAPVRATTINSRAETRITIGREGELHITASSIDASRSWTIIATSGGIAIETPTPTMTPMPTDTPMPTPTATDTPTPTATPPPSPTPENTPAPPFLPTQVRIVDPLDLIYALGAVLMTGVLAAAVLGAGSFDLETRLQPALMAIVTGLAGYVLYSMLAVQLADSAWLGPLIQNNVNQHWLAPVVAFICALAGALAWEVVYRLLRRRSRSEPPLARPN